MTRLSRRPWVPGPTDAFVERVASEVAARAAQDTARWVEDLAAANARIHDVECINLNPATNTMNPRAEALLASGLGSRPSLGYPTSAIGLPDAPAAGVRIGTNEVVRWGMTAASMPELADLFARAWNADSPDERVAGEISSLRGRFSQTHYHD